MFEHTLKANTEHWAFVITRFFAVTVTELLLCVLYWARQYKKLFLKATDSVFQLDRFNMEQSDIKQVKIYKKI